MSDELRNRIDDIFQRATEVSGKITHYTGDDHDVGRLESNLRGVATDAYELVTTTEPRRLLEAMNLDTLPDGTEPASVPEAIAEGDAATVNELGRLVSLAKLGARTENDEEVEVSGSVAALRRTMSDRDKETDRSSPDEDEQDDAFDGIESAIRSTVGKFDADLDEFKSAVSEAQERFSDDTDERNQTEDSDDTDERDVTDNQENHDETDDADFFGGDLVSDEESESTGLTSSRSDRYSTVAPSPGDRPDMHAIPRFSTMPGTDG